MDKIAVRIVAALCAAAGFLSVSAGDGAGVDGMHVGEQFFDALEHPVGGFDGLSAS